MKAPMKCLTVAAAAAIALLPGCSSHHGAGGDAGSAPPSGTGPGLTGDTYGLDVAPMGQGSALQYKGKAVTWTVRAVIDDKEVLSLAQKAFSDVHDGFQTLKVTGASKVTLEFSLFGAALDGKALLLATNVAAAAAADPTAKGIWETKCQKVTATFDVLEKLNTTADGKGTIGVDLKLCDFADLLVAPVVSISPVNAPSVDTRNVVYQCAVTNDPSANPVYAQGVVTNCKLGYVLPAAGAPATTSPYFDATGNAKNFSYPPGASLGDFQLSTDTLFLQAAGAPPAPYVLTEFPQHVSLPFGSYSDCYGLEIQLQYRDASTVSTGAPAKEFRLSWTETMDAAGVGSWSPADQSSLPPVGQALAGKDPVVHFYLFCTWQNKVGAAVAPLSATAG